MALKREIKDAYIEGGNSIYVKTHSNAVYVDDNETETLTQRLDNVKDSIKKVNSQLEQKAPLLNYIYVKDYEEFAEKKDNGDIDWSNALNKLANDMTDNTKIIFDNKQYICYSSVIFPKKRNIHIDGNNAYLLFKGEGEFLTLNPFYMYVNDINILGSGINSNQVGLKTQTYRTFFKNVNIQYFGKGCELRAVILKWEKSSIQNCNVGIEIRKYEDLADRGNVYGFSDRIVFEYMFISWNELGIKVENYEDITLKMFTIRDCNFNSNNQPMNLDDIFYPKIEGCWLEKNKTKSKLIGYRWHIGHNEHHSENDEFDIELLDDYQKMVKIDESVTSNLFNVRKVVNNTEYLTPITTNENKELIVDDKKLIKSKRIIESEFIVINDKSHTTNDDSSDAFSYTTSIDNLTIRKISAGIYEIESIDNFQYVTLNVDCFNNYNSKKVYHNTILSNTYNTDYLNYFSFKKIRIECVDENKTPCNAKITILINKYNN